MLTKIATARWREAFPPHDCDRSSSASPLRLEPAAAASPAAAGSRVCLTGAALQPCPASSPCCAAHALHHLELRVVPACAHAVRSVTVNGLPALEPTVEVYGAARDRAVLRLPGLNLTRANATGAKICFSLRAPCPSLAALCPEGDGRCTYALLPSAGPPACCPVGVAGLPPARAASPPPLLPEAADGTVAAAAVGAERLAAAPQSRLAAAAAAASLAVVGPEVRPDPPSPPSRAAPLPTDFPFSACNRTQGTLPYTLLPGAPAHSRSPAGHSLYCFTLAGADGPCADPASPACTAPLLSVEWWSYDTCRGSVRAAYVDGAQYPVSWDRQGTFRLTKLHWPPAALAAAPRTLCLELRRGSPCDTMPRFCAGGGGACRYALYDAGRGYCPTGTTRSA